MTRQTCNHLVLDRADSRCKNQAEWTFLDNSGARAYVCEHHLPDAERLLPDAMILPLETDNEH